MPVFLMENSLYSCMTWFQDWDFHDDQWGALHSEALSFTVNVAQTQVDVSANALHRLCGQRAAQVLSIGPGRGQAKAKPAE